MAAESNTAPSGTPQVPGRLAEGLRAAMAEPQRHPEAYIRLSVSGGVHGEAYALEYRMDATGHTTGRLVDEMKGRRHEAPAPSKQAPDPARFAALARSIDIESLMRADNLGGGFPPDSVVGRLEVSDGEQTASFVFLADDAQADHAGRRAPDPLRKAAAAVYQAAAAHLGTGDVKP
jgi:hypothetical protein